MLHDDRVRDAFRASSLSQPKRYIDACERLQTVLEQSSMVAALCDVDAAWMWARETMPNDRVLQGFLTKIKWPFENIPDLADHPARPFWRARHRELVDADKASRDAPVECPGSAGDPESSDVAVSVPTVPQSAPPVDTEAIAGSLWDSTTPPPGAPGELVSQLRERETRHAASSNESTKRFSPQRPRVLRVKTIVANGILRLGSSAQTLTLTDIPPGAIASVPPWVSEAISVGTGGAVASDARLIPPFLSEKNNYIDGGTPPPSLTLTFTDGEVDRTVKRQWTLVSPQLGAFKTQYKMSKDEHWRVTGIPLGIKAKKWFQDHFPHPTRADPLALTPGELRALLESCGGQPVRAALESTSDALAHHIWLQDLLSEYTTLNNSDELLSVDSAASAVLQREKAVVAALAEVAERELAESADRSSARQLDIHTAVDPLSEHEHPTSLANVDEAISALQGAMTALEMERPPEQPIEMLQHVATLLSRDGSATSMVYAERARVDLAMALRHNVGEDGTSEHSRDLLTSRDRLAALRTRAVMLARTVLDEAERELKHAKDDLVAAEAYVAARVRAAYAHTYLPAVHASTSALRERVRALEEELNDPQRCDERYRAGQLAAYIAAMNEFFSATLEPNSDVYPDAEAPVMVAFAHGDAVCFEINGARIDVTLMDDGERAVANLAALAAMRRLGAPGYSSYHFIRVGATIKAFGDAGARRLLNALVHTGRGGAVLCDHAGDGIADIVLRATTDRGDPVVTGLGRGAPLRIKQPASMLPV